MIGSDLYTPLPGRPVRRKRRVPVGLVVGIASVIAVGVGTAAVIKTDGHRGEPFAVGSIAIEPPEPVALQVDPVTTASIAPAAAPIAGGGPSFMQSQVENGVMVIRAGGAGGSTAPLTLKVPDREPPKPSFSPPNADIIEATSSGPLPRIGRDGQRPASLYAAAPVAAEGKTRIAILLGGMGLDRAATAEAARMLPASVTFGVAPYGGSLGEQVSTIRAAGHEVVLQMPMEDFGRSDRPFPHMLKVDQPDNSANLHWLMSRFAGYAGVGNYLGGRFLGDEEELKPMLQDVAARGLYFVDDGTAPRSLAMPVSHDIGLPATKADVVLDESPDPAAIAAALARLEALARERGFALGTAAGRPATNAALARYLTDAVKRGVVVVPISQAVGAKGSAEARR